MIIHLNGFPGVGKFTVAKILAECLGARLIDNHSIINPARIPWEHGSEGHIDLMRRIAAEIYKDLATMPHSEIQVFTNILAYEYGPDPDRFQAIVDLATKRQVPFVPILLECDRDENKRRIVSDDRATKQKLRDINVLEECYEKYTVIHPYGEGFAYEIDTTHLMPKQTADAIIDFLHSHDLLKACHPALLSAVASVKADDAGSPSVPKI